MGRLTSSDAGEFRRIRTLCYQGLDSATLRERAGDLIARHLHAPSFCFGVMDPSSSLPVHSVTVGMGPESIDAFLRLVMATPSLDFGPWTTREHKVLVLDQLVDDVETDPYLTEVLRPAGLRYDMQMACVSAGRSWGHLCVRRREDEGAFSSSDARFLTALAPHLTCGLRSAAARAALTANPGPGTGVVMLGPRGQIEMVNAVAQRLFERPASGTRHSFLTAVNIVTAMLQRLLLDEDYDGPPVLNVTDEAKGECYRVRAERVTGPDGDPRGLILFEPVPPVFDVGTPQSLRELGLTQREAEVALAVLRGETTSDIAAALVISPHTVRDYLRNVFEKLGVNSRQQLATRLMRGA